MKPRRPVIHLISVLLLFLWGGVMIYFYASGRMVNYLPPDGIFRPMALWGGIGMIIVGLYNLLTIRASEAECCEHDHGGGHDGEPDHGHHHAHEPDHAHGPGCCGHDHGSGHEGHEGHEDHVHHGHGQHAHGGSGAGHAHGILEESGLIGRVVAISLIAVPVAYAALRTPDRYSANAVINKGLYSPSYGEGARAEQFSLKKETGKAPAKPVAAAAPAAAQAVTPPSKKEEAPAGSVPPAPGSPAAPAGAEAKSYGSFTLADLKAQVPQSKEGNFMLEIPEIYYTAGDKEVQSVLAGQPVETIAQVLPEKLNNADGRRVRIFRMLIQCCAADARPFSIPAEFETKPPEFKDMTWVKVTGKMAYKKEGDQTVPVLMATSMTETAEPDNKMIY